MNIRQMALDFSAPALREIADAAEHRAKLMLSLEPKPWRMTQAERDAMATFRQLAAECRAVIAMQNGE